MLFCALLIVCLQAAVLHGYPSRGFGNMYVGCYPDENDRKLSEQANDVEGVRQCISICKQKRYRYAGLQYGKQCFCGNVLDGSPKSNKCTMPCENKVDICGGVWANSIYRTGYRGYGGGIPGHVRDYRYVGCYLDRNHRYLPKKMDDVTSVEQCIRSCYRGNYIYAGLQYGKQCFCGNVHDASPISNKCDMPCKETADICGGEWANSIYRTGYRGHGGVFPGPGVGYPGHGLGYPGDGIGYPGHGLGYPGDGIGYPGHGLGYPGDGIGYPGHGLGYPGDGIGYPGHGLGYPGHGLGYPGDGFDYPRHGLGYPGIGRGYPGQGQDHRYVGCYRDDYSQDLSKYANSVSGVDQCITMCNRQGHMYAGLKNGRQCYCGHQFSDSNQAYSCNVPCQFSGELCGGVWAYSIYKTDADYIGCFKDKKRRILPVKIGEVRYIRECKRKCYNYLFAGVQFGKECYCGNSINLHEEVQSCSMKCQSGERNCGGVWANSIYRAWDRNSAPRPVRSKYYMNHIGCYKDDSDRKLGHKGKDVEGVLECIQYCRRQRYTYAGVQYGKQCFCGNTHDHSSPTNKCNMMCKNGDEGCGGEWANSIYVTSYLHSSYPYLPRNYPY